MQHFSFPRRFASISAVFGNRLLKNLSHYEYRQVSKLVLSGIELGVADDIVFKR